MKQNTEAFSFTLEFSSLISLPFPTLVSIEGSIKRGKGKVDVSVAKNHTFVRRESSKKSGAMRYL